MANQSIPSKPTLDEPTKHGENFEKSFNSTMNQYNTNINEVDNLLNEKEQSFKRKIWDLSKMESLVHSDEKLSAIYNEMAEDGEEKYGYHYNETIMNMIFNEYIMNSSKYLAKYKMAIPKKKKRRDKSGIEKLKQDVTGKETDSNKKNNDMEKVNEHHLNTKEQKIKFIEDKINSLDDEKVDKIYKELENELGILETTGAASAGAYAPALSSDSKKEIDETTTSSSSGSYETPKAFSSDEKPHHDKPLWKGGTVLESMKKDGNYLTDSKGFKDFIKEMNESIVLNEKAESKAQQKFMGMVRAVQKGEMDPSKVSDKVRKAAEEMKPSDVKDFASTEHEDLPEKVNEDHLESTEEKIVFIMKNIDKVSPEHIDAMYDEIENKNQENDINENDSDLEILTRNLRSKIKLNELIGWAKKNVYYNTTDPEVRIKDFVESKGITIKQLTELVEHYLNNNLGYDGNIETEEQEFIADLLVNLQDMDTEETEIEPEEEMAVEEESMIEPKMETMATSGDNPTSMKLKDPLTSSNVDSNVTSMGESENKLDEDGFCRKDEVPVPGKVKGEKGACKKKTTTDKTDPEEKKKNPKNVEARIKRMKDYEKDLTNKKSEYEKDLEKSKKQMKELKENRKPSALIMLDRLKKENPKNFKKDFKDSLTKEYMGDLKKDPISDKEIKTTAEDELTKVEYENSKKMSQDIEKEKLSQNKGESFENVGNSTNENNKEILKRNATPTEQDLVDKMRQGMEDTVYDIKPSDRFEDRMKIDMGDEIYKKRQEAMDYKAKAPTYNKDTQPVDDDKTDEKEQYNKYKKGYMFGESMITGRYKDFFNKNKYISFNINETKEIEEINEDLYKVSVDGLGNLYDSKVELKEDYKDIEDIKFYTDGDDVYILKSTKKNINESKENKNKETINEQYNKMQRFIGYKPESFVDTKSTKSNRGF